MPANTGTRSGRMHSPGEDSGGGELTRTAHLKARQGKGTEGNPRERRVRAVKSPHWNPGRQGRGYGD